MEWKTKRHKTHDEMYPKDKPWHWWFAWRPVSHCGRTFWLCWLPRRLVRYTFLGRYGYEPEYSWPEHADAGNILGLVEGRKRGPLSRYKSANDNTRREVA